MGKFPRTNYFPPKPRKPGVPSTIGISRRPQPEPKPKQSRTIVLDCIHLDPSVFIQGGRAYRECLKGHGDICGCDKPRKCGLGICLDYLAPVTALVPFVPDFVSGGGFGSK